MKFSLFGRDTLSREDRELRELIPYNPEQQEAVIRSSICTGEKVAGFKDRQTGRFKDVMLIRSAYDEERFKRIFGLDSVTIEY